MSYTIWPDGPIGDALRAVYRERMRQDDLKAAGKFHWTCADSHGVHNSAKLAVLAEEFGEVSRLVVEELIESKRYDREKLHTELVQVAAVAVAWLEALNIEERESR